MVWSRIKETATEEENQPDRLKDVVEEKYFNERKIIVKKKLINEEIMK